MKTIKIIIFVFITIFTFQSCNKQNKEMLNQNSESKYDKEIRALISKMTLDEKIGQLNLVTKNKAITGPLVKRPAAILKEMTIQFRNETVRH